MKKLLTTQEHLANYKVKYNDDFTTLISEGQPRGQLKQNGIEWHSREDYQSLQMLFHMLGLYDYIEIMLDKDENMLYMRIMEE